MIRASVTMGLSLLALACASSQTPEPSSPGDSNVGGEAALAEHPEYDPMRADEYDPATETDPYMRRESNDDQMREMHCAREECPHARDE